MNASPPANSTIRLTSPGRGSTRWVYIDPPLPSPALNREFASAQGAMGYAQHLAEITGWPIGDAILTADSPPCQMPFDDREAKINELLWVMTSLVPEDQIAAAGRVFWAGAARQNAEIIVNAGDALADDDRAVMLILGGAMLRQAAAHLCETSVDDVLKRVMVLGGAW